MNEKKQNISLSAGTLQLTIKSEKVPLQNVSCFASRCNNRRGFLFVSKVLGKHYPVSPNSMREIYRRLAGEIVTSIGSIEKDDSFAALAMAETATGFGAGIYEEFCKIILTQKLKNNTTKTLFGQSTRYHDSRVHELLSFEEPHSHARGHWLTKPPPEIRKQLTKITTLLLLDDEQSTGTTAENVIKKLLPFTPNLNKVLIVSILNWMGEERKKEFKASFKESTILFPALISGDMKFTPKTDFHFNTLPQSVGNGEYKDKFLAENSGRRWYQQSPKICTEILKKAEQIVQKSINDTRPIMVLGTGEFTFLPFLFAEHLEKKGKKVLFQSTTRSPILVEEDKNKSGINSVIYLEDNYNEGVANFVYNLIPERYQSIFVCYETEHNKNNHKLPQELEKAYKVVLNPSI